MSLPDRLRLGLRFDAAALAEDVCALDSEQWEPHFNTGYYAGDWSGVALRTNGAAVGLYPNPQGGSVYGDTPAMARCPHVRATLERFDCPLTSVRFLRLGPGARVREHRDYGLTLENGEARLHVPVLSGAAEFFVNGALVPMQLGECWYVDVSAPHAVANNGDRARVHLVIDVRVNSWLKEQLNDAASRV